MTKYTFRNLVVAILFLLLSGGCTTSSDLQVKKALPQSKLDYYYDPFDMFQEGLWIKGTVLMPRQVRRGDFLLGDAIIDSGKLRFVTKPGCFSKVIVGGKIKMIGDFDIQIDCDIDFMGDNLNKDHYFFFVNLKGPGRGNVTGVNFLRKGKSNRGIMRSIWHRSWDTRGQKNLYIDSFNGTIRFIRKGRKISTLYMSSGQIEWTKMTIFTSATKECSIVMGLQNFIGSRNLTPASSSLSAIVDNFKINAAENIEEGEI